MAVRVKNYLITSEVVFDPSFHTGVKNAIGQIRALAGTMESKKFAQKVSRSSPAFRVVVHADSGEDNLLAVADALELAIPETFSKNGMLHNKVIEVMNGIGINVKTRFSESVGVKSGKLSAAIYSQDVVVDANNARIVGAVMNFKQLDKDTRGAAVRGARTKQRLKSYPYQTPGGEISVTGYWAFMDQGWTHWRTGEVYPGKEFILDLNGQYHEDDQELLDSIPDFLTEQINVLNAETAAALRG